MITPEAYVALLRDHLRPVPTAVEEVPVTEAVGRVLAGDVRARLAVPPFTNSAMDGFALDSSLLLGEGPWTLPVSGDTAAGDVPGPWAGGAVRIMTGAPLPEGADCVVRVEDTDAVHDAVNAPASITFAPRPRPGQNVRRRGEDLLEGDVVMEAGQPLGMLAPASLVSVGISTVPVRCRPRVAVVATGAELVASGTLPGEAQIPDSDSLIVAALAKQCGADVVSRSRVGDDTDGLWETLREAAAGADLVVTTGGVSMGARDVVKAVGVRHGFAFLSVAMQPGKPQGHGLITVDGRVVPVLCLPGNPVSVAVSFTAFARVLLADMLGTTTPPPRRVVAGVDWRAPQGRRQYLPALEVPEEDGVGTAVRPVHALGSGSHLVASLHRASVLAVVPAGHGDVRAGETVEVLDFAHTGL